MELTASTETRRAREKVPAVLVVDDDFSLREALCAALEAEGFAVASAGNGKEALEYLRHEEPPCVILLDLMMPVMNGWEFRSEQKRDSRLASIPVVVLTALSRSGDEELRGVERFLRKPVDLAQLIETLKTYCC